MNAGSISRMIIEPKSILFSLYLRFIQLYLPPDHLSLLLVGLPAFISDDCPHDAMPIFSIPLSSDRHPKYVSGIK